MNEKVLALAGLLIAAGACSGTPGGSPGGPDGGGAHAGFAGNWVARPYRWNVTCSNASGTRGGGSTAQTDNLSKYRLEVDGATLRMYVTDQPVGCVQLFSISGNRASHTGDDGTCAFTVDGGEDGPGTRTTLSDELVLSADGSSFDETVRYKVVYPDDYACTGDDSGTYVRN